MSLIVSSSIIQVTTSEFEDEDYGFFTSSKRELNANFGRDIHDIPILVSPLYLKLNASEVLDNQNRANIYNLISSNPGISFGTITRELRISNGTVQHHLRILETHGHVQSKRNGRQTRYYLTGVRTSELSQTQESILQAIEENLGSSQSDIARSLGISRQLVNYHIKILVDKGLIEVVKEKVQSFCYSLNDYYRQWD
jgi:predicted transcriptional regulator